MKIIVAEKISPTAIKLLKSEPGWDVVTPDQISGDLPKQLEDADALIVRSAVKADANLLQHAQKLRVIGRAGVGVDNVDLEAATRRGIAVMNTPGGNAVAVAEHTLGLMLAMAHHIPAANKTMHEGKWEKKSLQGTELRGKTLGVVGLGRIGMEVARRALAFGMTVLAHDPFVSPKLADEHNIKMTSLDEVLSASDYITLHLGLTPQTVGMVNAQSIAKMKKGVRLVNCARGELVNEADLAAALKSGQVSAAAVDVFAKEPPKETPLLGLPNVLATPHIAGSTFEAQEAVGVQIAAQVKEYLTKGVIQNAVNVPSVTDEEYAQIRPWITLAERLGAFVVQVVEEGGSLEEISLRYSGALAGYKTDLVRNAAVQGVLNQMGDPDANIINATSLAQGRGVRIREDKRPKSAGGGAGNVLSILVTTSAGEHLLRGAVLHGNSPRLLGVDNIDIEANLEPYLIFLRNRDVPGVIGRVGTIFGNNNVNIADFSLGRREHNGKKVRDAIAVFRVDNPVPESVLDELRQFEAITYARAIRLERVPAQIDEAEESGEAAGA
jgi:D-3-phosphoglycerate dehydrogenase